MQTDKRELGRQLLVDAISVEAGTYSSVNIADHLRQAADLLTNEPLLPGPEVIAQAAADYMNKSANSLCDSRIWLGLADKIGALIPAHPRAEQGEALAQAIYDATPHLPTCELMLDLGARTYSCSCDRPVRAIIAAEDAERERCAGIAEATMPKNDVSDWTVYAHTRASVAQDIAAAIRNPEGDS